MNKFTGLEKLSQSLYGEGLKLINYADVGWNTDKKSYYAVQHKDFANPMLFFNIDERGKDYNGSIDFKIINTSLYTPLQVYRALRLVNEFMIGDE